MVQNCLTKSTRNHTKYENRRHNWSGIYALRVNRVNIFRTEWNISLVMFAVKFHGFTYNLVDVVVAFSSPKTEEISKVVYKMNVNECAFRSTVSIVRSA